MSKEAWPQSPKKIDDKEVKIELQQKKKKVQDWLNSLNLNVLYHNAFDKQITKFREDYNRYLICYVASNQKRDAIFEQAKNLGYICEKGPVSDSRHNKPDDYINNDDDSKNFSFRIDLESVNLMEAQK